MKLYRYVAVVLALVLVVVFPQAPKRVYGAGSSASKVNAVLVLDTSKSMTSNDSENIRFDALKLFIDMCRSKGDKLGMVLYGGTAAKIHDLKQINTPSEKEELKNFMADVQPQDNCDIGHGLINAVANLDRYGSKDANNVIILVSSGKNTPQRPAEQSTKDIDASIKRAKDTGYRVYTVMLNSGGDKALLYNIASQTGGKSYIVNSSSELPKTLSQIFADSSQHKLLSLGTIECNGDYQNVDIKIPNSNIVEANICAMSNSKLELKLTDNNGVSRDLPSDGVQYSATNKYSMIKLLSPQKGVWTLGIKGAVGEKVSINLVLNYDFQIEVLYIPDSGYKVGSNVKVEVYITSNGKRIKDKELYDQISGRVIAVMREIQRKENVELTNTGTMLTGNYAIKDKLTYDIIVRVEGSGFYRESPVKIINVINTTPVVKTNIASIDLNPKSDKIINLKELFSDSDNDKLSYYFETDKSGVADISVDGDFMIIKPTSIGTLKIKITADDKKGGVATLDTKIKVSVLSYLVYVVIALAAIVLIFIVMGIVQLSKKKSRRRKKHTPRVEEDEELTGKFMISVKNTATGEAFPPIFKNLEGINSGTSLAKIISEIPESSELKKIKVSIDNNNIIFYNESDCNIVWDKETPRNKRRYVLYNEEKICFEPQKSSNAIHIQYLAREN